MLASSLHNCSLKMASDESSVDKNVTASFHPSEGRDRNAACPPAEAEYDILEDLGFDLLRKLDDFDFDLLKLGNFDFDLLVQGAENQQQYLGELDVRITGHAVHASPEIHVGLRQTPRFRPLAKTGSAWDGRDDSH